MTRTPRISGSIATRVLHRRRWLDAGPCAATCIAAATVLAGATLIGCRDDDPARRASPATAPKQSAPDADARVSPVGAAIERIEAESGGTAIWLTRYVREEIGAGPGEAGLAVVVATERGTAERYDIEWSADGPNRVLRSTMLDRFDALDVHRSMPRDGLTLKQAVVAVESQSRQVTGAGPVIRRGRHVWQLLASARGRSARFDVDLATGVVSPAPLYPDEQE